MNILNGLNDMQKQAVLHTEGPLLLLAGAGSGKTRVLTHRIAYLIEKGVNPFNILAITFTNKAAKEMKERVCNITPHGDEVWVSTFHSTCVRILRREIEHINFDRNFTIFDAKDCEKLIKDCLVELDLNDKMYTPKSAQAFISNLKNNLTTASSFLKTVGSNIREENFGNIYKLYEEKLIQNNAVDFDDLIMKTVQLFVENKDVLEKYQERFKYILVDEYQDTNQCQYKLIKLLSLKYKNLCVVGDDDQSIYGWRGADISNILDFEKDYNDAKVIKLEQNYRSTQNILNSANEVIKNNSGRKNKTLWTENDSGESISYYKAFNEQDESVYVMDNIKKGINNNMNYSDFCILYRTNAQSRQIEDTFVKSNIPYRLFGGTRFYERREIKDILAYLKLIYNLNDQVSLLRIINVPKRGIGTNTIEKISNYSYENGLSFFEALGEIDNITSLGARSNSVKEFYKLVCQLIDYSKDLNVKDLLEKIVEITGYNDQLKLEHTEEANQRIENIEELINKSYEFIQSSEDGSLTEFLEEISLVADIDNYEDDADTVTLMTLHSSKGLEFNTVFIIGFEENIFPSYRSIDSMSETEMEEERRLCYVGITRAEKSLHLTSANSRMLHGRVSHNQTSRFFNEIPAELINDLSPVKKAITKSPVKKLEHNNFKSDLNRSKKFLHTGEFSAPKDKQLDFTVGDTVRQMKYGKGTVIDIKPAGADFEVTVDFGSKGIKKFMGFLSKLKKV